jgi:hypothetical protein
LLLTVRLFFLSFPPSLSPFFPRCCYIGIDGAFEVETAATHFVFVATYTNSSLVLMHTYTHTHTHKHTSFL